MSSSVKAAATAAADVSSDRASACASIASRVKSEDSYNMETKAERQARLQAGQVPQEDERMVSVHF